MAVMIAYLAVTLAAFETVCLLGVILIARHHYHAHDVARRERDTANNSRLWQLGRKEEALRDVHRLEGEVARLTEEAATWRRAYEQTAPDTVDEGAPA